MVFSILFSMQVKKLCRIYTVVTINYLKHRVMSLISVFAHSKALSQDRVTTNWNVQSLILA